jgi:cytochrome c peroxidase/serine/threonine protein kinase
MINSTLDGRYVISRQLGQGGMGVVYEARHTGTGRRVAVKLITSQLAQTDSMMARFEREARAAGAIDSEHIVQVFDSGKDPATGYPYLVMELLSGASLEHLIRRLGQFSTELALSVVAQACVGLQKAHEAGVLHRDIKPANVFLARRDGNITVKLLDFGIAKLCAEETSGDQQDLTGANGIVGSPRYMSPEQARSAKDLDFRTDVWSLGVVLYRMIAGRTPHERGLPLVEMLYTICSVPVPPLQRFAPSVSAEVAAIVHRALQIDRTQRFGSAAEMLAAVKPLLPGGYAIREERFISLAEAARAEAGSNLSGREPRTSGVPLSHPPPSLWSETPPPPSQTPSAVCSHLTPPPSWTPSELRARPSALDVSPAASQLAAEPRAGEPGPGAGPRSETSGYSTATPAVNAMSNVPVQSAGWARWKVAVGLAAAVLTGGVAAALTLRAPHAAAPPAASAFVAASAAAESIQLDPERLASFGPLPGVITSAANPLTDEKIALGRMLFYDARLSKNHDLSCNSCHRLDQYGVDGAKVSIGHAHQEGRRNTPTVYNSAGYIALFWDGRMDVLEEQATAPMLNPSEMAMNASRAVSTLRSMPEYVKAFTRAFPNDPTPVNVTNTARALAAFERKLFTRGRWDRFLEGERSALTEPEKQGFNAFVDTGCISCHFGPHVGATMFQKLGLVKAWPDTMDRGRFEITQRPADFMVFRVPSLRDVAATGPYFHDGSLTSLEEAIRLMARHQLGKELTDETIGSIATWLRCLTGELPRDYIAKPKLPESGPHTPSPDPE